MIRDAGWERRRKVMMSERQISERRDEWISAVNGRDLERYAALVSETVVWIPPGGTPIEGREEFQAWLQPFFERFVYVFDIPSCSVNVTGDWALEKGVFDTKMTGTDGREMRHSGRYIVIWHRELDDVWYIDRYVDDS